jgi:AsmA-like C-terminal region
MGSFFQHKHVRTFLKAFKWCRVAVLLIILLAVGILTYLELVGFPDFLKNPLLRALRQRGFEAEFTDARLAWGPSIIIENSAFSPTNQSASPHLSAAWTQLNLNAAALMRARLHVNSFEVLRANLRVPVSPTNQEPILLTNVNLHVTLLSNSVARLADSSVWCRGVRIQINGEIKNFNSIRDWNLPPALVRTSTAEGPSKRAEAMRRLTAWEIFQRISFAGTPLLKMHFSADGRDRNTLRAELEFSAASSSSPWAQTGPVYLRAACARILNSGQAPFFQARFMAHDVTTPWAAGRDLSASVDFSREASTNFLAEVHLSGQEMSTSWNSNSDSNWVRLANLHWDGTTTFLSPTFKPDKANGSLQATEIESTWGSAEAISLILQTQRTNDSSPADPAWGRWNQIKPLGLDWQANATNISTPKLKLERVTVEGGWHAPQLTVNKLEAVMYRGHLNLDGSLNVAAREVLTHAAVDFDPHQIAPLLTGPAQHWISLYDWDSPPRLRAGLRFVLPPWTNRIDVWPEESRNSIQLAGDFSVGRGAFRDIAVTSARSYFSYTNRTWNVSALQVNAAGGSLDLDYAGNELAHCYHFKFDSKLDPSIALPLLTPQQQRTLSQMSFPERPEIQGDVWGDWHDPATIGFAATLATGHFLVLGETVNKLNANVDFTNRFLRVSQLTAFHDTGRVDVPLAGFDFATNHVTISMSNAASTLDPEPVRRALGEIAPPFLKEIHFDSPPLVKASGSFVPGDDSGTDMHLSVQGNRFHWNKITADSVKGGIHFHVRTVEVTNIQAGFYGNGTFQGQFEVAWEQHKDRFSTDFSFTDINVSSLATELTGKHSKLEGMLDGQLTLGTPFGASETNVFGQGWLHLHNGLLWDIKLFGVFSPLLNAIAPGAGDNRAREASTTFVITNGILSTDNLEIRSSGFRLLYNGTIDWRRRLNARVEANLLRDTPLFGHFLGWMLTPVDRIFEYRITGTLDKPIAKPLYIPKLFMDFLRPFHSLKGLLPPPASKTNASAPAAKQPSNSQ